MGTFTRWRGEKKIARPFWIRWLIGVGKFVGVLTAIFGGIFVGSWLCSTYPWLGNALGITFIGLTIAVAGLVTAPTK